MLAGAHGHQTVGMLQFPDHASARGWYESPDYQALIANRDEAAEMTVIAYDAP